MERIPFRIFVKNTKFVLACQLRQWIKVYNDGKRLREFTGGSSMKKAGSTTYEND